MRQRLLGCIGKVGQQGEVQIGIAIAQIAYLQGLDQTIDLPPTAEQSGYHHHAAVNVGNTL